MDPEVYVCVVVGKELVLEQEHSAFQFLDTSYRLHAVLLDFALLVCCHETAEAFYVFVRLHLPFWTTHVAMTNF